MVTIQQLVEKMCKADQGIVVAHVIHVDGSAYRKEGAWMCFLEDGSTIGLLSGGCLEQDLHYRAQSMFHTGGVDLFDFDMRAEDDLGWGRGAGCNGIVTVMMRDVDPEFKKALSFMLEQLHQGQTVYYLQSLDSSYDYLFANLTSRHGTLTKNPTIDEVQAFQQSARSKWMQDGHFYEQWICPEPNLYLFGAGVDARPFAALASTVGYAVHVCDWRDGLCTKENFPAATSFIVAPIENLLNRIIFNELDSVVIMTHDFQVDKQILHNLQSLKLLYVGLLGSEKRTRRLLGQPVPDWLNSPIGLSIGAEGPEEIAVSIVAEMISIRKRRAICPSLASI